MWGSGAAFSSREGALPFGACGAKARPAGGAAALPPQQRPVHRIRPWLRQRRAATANKKAPNGRFVCFLCYRIRLGTKCNASAEVKWYSVSPYSP